MNRCRDLQEKLQDELKFEMIKDEMKRTKIIKLKDGNYAPGTGRSFSDSKQYLYEILYNIQQIIAE